jgi:hypothetical protein
MIQLILCSESLSLQRFVLLVQYSDNIIHHNFVFLLYCPLTELYLPGKLAKPRQLHNSQWGMMCPAETPEGQVCIFVDL